MPEDRGASGSSLRRAVDGELLEAENPLDYLVLLALEAKRYDGHWDGDDATASHWVVAQWCQEIGYVPDLRDFETGQQVPRGQEPGSYEPAFYGQPVADGGQPAGKADNDDWAATSTTWGRDFVLKFRIDGNEAAGESLYHSLGQATSTELVESDAFIAADRPDNPEDVNLERSSQAMWRGDELEVAVELKGMREVVHDGWPEIRRVVENVLDDDFQQVATDGGKEFGTAELREGEERDDIAHAARNAVAKTSAQAWLADDDGGDA